MGRACEVGVFVTSYKNKLQIGLVCEVRGRRLRNILQIRHLEIGRVCEIGVFVCHVQVSADDDGLVIVVYETPQVGVPFFPETYGSDQQLWNAIRQKYV